MPREEHTDGIDLERNKKISEGNKEKVECPKCDEPQFITQFAKHVRNCTV